MTESAPATNKPRRYRSPCLVILPSLSLPPLECCFGTSPIQAQKLRPDRKTFGSATVATTAVESTGPTPGSSIEPHAHLVGSVSGRDQPVELQYLLLEPAQLSSKGRALSGHKTRQAYAGYAKATIERALAATRRRHAYRLANTPRTSIQNEQRNGLQNENRAGGAANTK